MYLSESPISRSIWRRISYGNLGIKVECRRIEEWACGRILGWCQQPCRTFSTHMQIYCLVNYYALVTHREAGAQPRLKSWGGPRFGFQHRGACAQRPAKGRAGCCCGRRSPPPAVRVWGITPGKFVKTQMLNPAFWWLYLAVLAVKFLAFWKPRPRSWGTNTLLVPQPKSWGTSLPRSIRLFRLCREGFLSLMTLNVYTYDAWHVALRN